jgi:hypothetical protein
LPGLGAGEFLGLEAALGLTGRANLAVESCLGFASPPATELLAARRLVSGGGFVC